VGATDHVAVAVADHDHDHDHVNVNVYVYVYVECIETVEVFTGSPAPAG
jgi:hypothetical protein